MNRAEGLLTIFIFLYLASLSGIARAQPDFSDSGDWASLGYNASHWFEYQRNIPALETITPSTIENVSLGNSFFIWKTDRIDGFTSISFWKNNKINLSTCKSKNWTRVDYYKSVDDKLELRFLVTETGPDVRLWVAFPPQNVSPDGTILPGESEGLPIIKIRSPVNGATTCINTTTDFLENKFAGMKVEFDYEPLDNEIIKNCELVIYKNLKLYDTVKNESKIENNVTNKFLFEFTNPGAYSYKIICIDSSNRRNESRNQTILVHPVMIIKTGGDIVESIERAKLENISVITLIGGNYRFSQKNSSIDINQLNLIGDSDQNITISPFDNKTDMIPIDSNNSLIKNITFMNLTLNISGTNILIIGNKFIGKHCGIYSISPSNISIKNNDFHIFNGKHNGLCAYVEKSNILNISGNSFKGDVGLMINNSGNVSIMNNNNQATTKCYYKNCRNATISDGCILCPGR